MVRPDVPAPRASVQRLVALLTAPLLLVPLWTRRWWLYLPIGVWLVVNPVITPPARDLSSFATRAILG